MTHAPHNGCVLEAETGSPLEGLVATLPIAQHATDETQYVLLVPHAVAEQGIAAIATCSCAG